MQTLTDDPGPEPEVTSETPEMPAPLPRWVQPLTTVVLVAIAIVAGVVVARWVFGRALPHSFAGTAFSTPVAAAPLDGLVLDTGEAASLAAYGDDVVLIYFGYTFCPDVCPTTLSTAARAIDSLGDEADDVELLMVSVDPQRDPLDELGQYVRHFRSEFVGVGGTEDAIAEVAALYGIFYELQEPDENGFYLVDHTASLIGIDRDKNLRVLWPPTVSTDDLVADLKELL